MEECVQISSTAGSREAAQRIAHALVGERLAACVHIATVESCFRWQDAVAQADEFALHVKTTASRAAAVQGRIRALHSYEMPEVIVLPIIGGSSDYLAWIVESVSPR